MRIILLTINKILSCKYAPGQHNFYGQIFNAQFKFTMLLLSSLNQLPDSWKTPHYASMIPGMLKLLFCSTMSGWWQGLECGEMIFLNLKGTLKLAWRMGKVWDLTLQIPFYIAIEQLVGLSLGNGKGQLKTPTKLYISNQITPRPFFEELHQTVR